MRSFVLVCALSSLSVACGCSGDSATSPSGSGGGEVGSGGGESGGGESGGGGAGGDACDCAMAQSCLGGECLDWECEPEEEFCSGDTVRICAADGLSSTEQETCGEDQYCDVAGARCQEGLCAPHLPACVSDTSWRVCNATGDGYEPGATQCASTGESCNGGSCNSWVCTPSASTCQGQQVRRCSANGLSSSVEETCEGELGVCLESGSNASCVECVPDQTQCSGNGVQTCNANGEWGTAVACASTTPHCSAGSCGQPPSCQGLADCNGESCCTSPLVTGASTFYRGHDSVTVTTDYPATVADFRLDKYEVTVGRFRKFVDAVVGGWRPTAGSGKHAHLNDGQGLTNSGSGGGYEPGWDVTWNGDDTAYRMHAAKEDWDSSLSGTNQTWTPTIGANENRPISSVNWYQSYAFCIWDGGFLPSEAEWNYAAAGGTEQRYYPWSSPADSTTIDCTYANHLGCGGAASNVGSLSPKGNGLYGQSDLAGNVWQWVLDWYVSPYQTPCDNCASTDPASNRVMRGGGFNNSMNLRSSYRYGLDAPGFRSAALGVRCARTP